jgi:excisionase family DNA binding protein
MIRPEPLLVRERNAAEILGVSRPTFRKWIAAGRISEGHMIDGCRVWRYADLKKFADSLAG